MSRSGPHTEPDYHMIEEDGSDVADRNEKHYASNAREDGTLKRAAESAHENNRHVVHERYCWENWQRVQLQNDERGVPMACGAAHVLVAIVRVLQLIVPWTQLPTRVVWNGEPKIAHIDWDAVPNAAIVYWFTRYYSYYLIIFAEESKKFVLHFFYSEYQFKSESEISKIPIQNKFEC